MNPLSSLSSPPLIRPRSPGSHHPPRVVFLTSPPEHYGKTFLGLQICDLFEDVLPVEADNGARSENDFGSVPGMEAADFDHSMPARRLTEILEAPVNRNKTFLVDNANHANPEKLAGIIEQITPLARSTVLVVMEDGRPKFKGFLASLRAAIGAKADWMICRNRYRNDNERYRFMDEDDWRESAERAEYRRTGGSELILPRLHPRLTPISYVLNARLHSERTHPRAAQVWFWDRNRVNAYKKKLRESLTDEQEILLTLPPVTA